MINLVPIWDELLTKIEYLFCPCCKLVFPADEKLKGVCPQCTDEDEREYRQAITPDSYIGRD